MKLNNKERILDYLREKGKATIRELTINLWIQTPQEYIRQLRAEGYNIPLVYEDNNNYGTYIWNEPELSLKINKVA